eukprot:tig00001095_g7023.t1
MAICMTALPRINCTVNCKGAESGRGRRARARRSPGEESPEPEAALCVSSESDSELPELLSPKSAGSMASAASSAASSRASSRSNSLALDREPGGPAPPPRPPSRPRARPPALRARLVLNIWEASARGPGDLAASGAGAGAARGRGGRWRRRWGRAQWTSRATSPSTAASTAPSPAPPPPDPHHSASLACANWAVDSRGLGAMTREAFEGSLEALAAGWAAAAAREPAAAPRMRAAPEVVPGCCGARGLLRLLAAHQLPGPARRPPPRRLEPVPEAPRPSARRRGGAGLAGLLAGDGDPRGLRRFALHNRLRALLPPRPSPAPAPAPAPAAGPRRGRAEGDIGLELPTPRPPPRLRAPPGPRFDIPAGAAPAPRTPAL